MSYCFCHKASNKVECARSAVKLGESNKTLQCLLAAINNDNDELFYYIAFIRLKGMANYDGI